MSFSDIKMEKDANRTMPFQEKKNKNAKFIGHIQNKMLILLIQKKNKKTLLEWLRRMNIKSVHILRLKGQIVLQHSYTYSLTRVPSNCMLNFRVKINSQKSWQLFENKSSNH